jgi:hypothetical protein
VQLKGITLSVVPVGWWPLDVGGMLGEPFTRTIDKKLPWATQSGEAAVALAAAGITLAPSMTDPVRAFRAN